ncbi:MAG: hypothetical protein HY958_09460 [Bacteroidia bacterium]|nr:hypothetical protein [Bacteroidia bacterium]
MKILKDWHVSHHYVEFKILPNADAIRDEADLFENLQHHGFYGNCGDDNIYELWFRPEETNEETAIEIAVAHAAEQNVNFEFHSHGIVYEREIKKLIGTHKEFRKEKSE